VTVFRYLDILLVLVAAPILLLIGVPAVGYAAGAGAWFALRVVEIGVNRYAASLGDSKRELMLRLVDMLARVFLLAIAVILVRQSAGKDDALTTLFVIVLAFTIHLVTSFADKPGKR
jgi:hypothetical protein